MAAIPGRRSGFSNTMRRFLALILVALVIAGSFPAHAQPASCDPDYWNSMKAKAWLEAQREIAQNQNLIYKPDSVLEYTCFDKFLGHLSNIVHVQHRLFSETTTWGAIPGTNMETALSGLVGSALLSYINMNFSHVYLGGRGNGPGVGVSAVSSANYTCSTMSSVWQQAKCLNFVQTAPVNRTARDDFFNLSWFASNDPRDIPTVCTADARWANNTNLALNTPAVYTEETFSTYANHFATTGCPAAPIPTGVRVTRNTFAPYDEKVCINPGCAYNVGGDNCVPAAGPPPAAPSDRNLKENIVFAGIENGHNVYQFNYIGQPQKYIGVMADEVEKTNPDAVTKINGYKAVYYDRIGVRFRAVP